MVCVAGGLGLRNQGARKSAGVTRSEAYGTQALLEGLHVEGSRAGAGLAVCPLRTATP